METDVNNRLEKITKMKDFLLDVDVRIKNIVGELNWDYNELYKNHNNLKLCSVNPQHRIPTLSAKDHEEKCRWLHEGYRLDDKPFSEFSDNGAFTVITPELQTEIIGIAASKTDNFELGNINVDRPVPQTSNRLEQDFTRDERLAIYDYVVANTQKADSFSELAFLSLEERKEKKREMQQWEIAAAERDAKRRRASYRNKVHTNKKTHTEILREVIESQMDCLKEEAPTPHPPPEKPKEEKKYKKHDDRTSHKSSNGHRKKSPHRHHKKSHHHEKHKKKSHHKRDRSTSRSRHKKKHKKSVSRSRSREKHRKSSSK